VHERHKPTPVRLLPDHPSAGGEPGKTAIF